MLEAPIGFEPMTLELCRPLQLTTLPWRHTHHYREFSQNASLFTGKCSKEFYIVRNIGIEGHADMQKVYFGSTDFRSLNKF